VRAHVCSFPAEKRVAQGRAQDALPEGAGEPASRALVNLVQCQLSRSSNVSFALAVFPNRVFLSVLPYQQCPVQNESILSNKI